MSDRAATYFSPTHIKASHSFDKEPATPEQPTDIENYLSDDPEIPKKSLNKQQSTLPIYSNDDLNTENLRTTRTPRFFKRLYTALYIEALVFVLIQIKSAQAATEFEELSTEEMLALGPEGLPLDVSHNFVADINIPAETTSNNPLLSINCFINLAEQPIRLSLDTQADKYQYLLDNQTTHDNFNLLNTSKLQSKPSTGLLKYSEDNELRIFDEDNHFIIELDDDDLLYSDEDLALFGMDDYHFLLINSDLLNMFSNNTVSNSWESLKPGEEFYILQQTDILEDDIEIFTAEEEIYFDETDESGQSVNIDYFVYEDTIIGMAFTLPDDFYQSHANIDFATLFT